MGPVHAKSWRAVWAYAKKRAVRDNKTLTLQENKTRAVVAAEKAARTPQFVKTRNGANEVDEAPLARARGLVGLVGLPHQHPRRPDVGRRSDREL